MYFLGIDIGSATCDAVLIDVDGGILSSSVVPTGARSSDAVERAKREVIGAAGITEGSICGLVSTGYGRDRVHNRIAAVTEIKCHALGIHHAMKDARLIVDIGGQDSKIIRLDEKGRVMDFVMNDRCAAGTGCFLENMAAALQVDCKTLAILGRGASKNLTLSSVCTVFAKSEAVSLIADGVEVKEIVDGLNRSVAARILSLVRRVCAEPRDTVVAMSGGVANNEGVVRAISDVLGTKVRVPRDPDIIGALGAAMIARRLRGDGSVYAGVAD